MTKTKSKGWEKVIDTQFGHIDKAQLKALIRLIISANIHLNNLKWKKRIEGGNRLMEQLKYNEPLDSEMRIVNMIIRSCVKINQSLLTKEKLCHRK